MQRAGSVISNEKGSIITMAVIFLALLTVIGIASTNISTTEVKVSTNGVLHNLAFYTAESGVEAGRAALNNIKIADPGNWDKLLFNIDAAEEDKKSISWNGVDCYTLNDIIDAQGGRRVGPVRFSLTVVDNDDLDNNPEVDSDDTVILTSTLAAPYRNATATITTTVQGGAVDFAQQHYNAGSSGEAVMETEAASTNKRWDGE